MEALNERQKKAKRNIKYAANDIIGGLENTITDYGEDSEYGISAAETLGDHEGLVQYVYDEATTSIYGPGYCHFGKRVESELKELRFCGKEFLMSMCEHYVTELGY